MKDITVKNIVVLIIPTFLIGSIFCYNAIAVNPLQNDGWADISVEEAWTFINDTSNGIQIPIDVRFDFEWVIEHIDTPSPEKPKNHCVCEWSNETILQDFISLYTGEEIILYSYSGSRSVRAAEILVENNFSGTIYNMLGGVIAWKEAGYPTKSNQPPEKPNITGTINGKTGTDYLYFISTNDPENDDVFYYVNWSDGTNTLYIGTYKSGEEITLNHTWMEDGTYIVQVKAWDQYQAESDKATLEVSMPKNKSYVNTPFLTFLENHPHLFPLLRQILGL